MSTQSNNQDAAMTYLSTALDSMDEAAKMCRARAHANIPGDCLFEQLADTFEKLARYLVNQQLATSLDLQQIKSRVNRQLTELTATFDLYRKGGDKDG